MIRQLRLNHRRTQVIKALVAVPAARIDFQTEQLLPQRFQFDPVRIDSGMAFKQFGETQPLLRPARLPCVSEHLLNQLCHLVNQLMVIPTGAVPLQHRKLGVVA